MEIEEIKISNFRNYKEQKIKLNNNINIFFGENAQGKTNIIEAIYLCSLGKSFRTSKDKEMINKYQENSCVEIKFKKKDRAGKIKVQLGDKKSIHLNGVKLKKLSELIGNLNIVLFNPEDINILKGSPQKRRRFLDVMIGQLRPNYIFSLNSYLKILDERNAFLKNLKDIRKQEELLDIWDERLAEYGIEINRYRKEFIAKIDNKIKKIHSEITNNREEIKIEYCSDSNDKEKYLELLKSRRSLDIFKGFTTKGIHRDDFMIYINGEPINIYGSQGQNRTAVLSLKLSELRIIKDEIGENPVLLLDDFMSELDKKRISNFLENITDTQVIITCTEKLDIEKLEFFMYNVIDGNVYNNDQIKED